jgi:hypothetical protein
MAFGYFPRYLEISGKKSEWFFAPRLIRFLI